MTGRLGLFAAASLNPSRSQRQGRTARLGVRAGPMAIVSRAATTAGSPSGAATTRRWSMRCGPILKARSTTGRDQRRARAIGELRTSCVSALHRFAPLAWQNPSRASGGWSKSPRRGSRRRNGLPRFRPRNGRTRPDGGCAPVSCASYKLNSCGNRREWARSDVLVPTDLFPNLIIRGIELPRRLGTSQTHVLSLREGDMPHRPAFPMTRLDWPTR